MHVEGASAAPAALPDDLVGTLHERLDELRRRFGDRSGAELLRALLEGGPLAGRTALVSSFGTESAVLLHMVAEIDPALPVIFLDTGKLFPETNAYREELTRRLGLRDVRVVRPDDRVVARLDPDGTLWRRTPDHCCHIRKTAPLDQALQPFAAWITGRKRFHGDVRATLATIEGEPSSGRVKLNPLALWSSADIEAYRRAHDLPAHPLAAAGYRSIGCAPCTRPVGPDEQPRAGRWWGIDKSECGIHRPGI